MTAHAVVTFAELRAELPQEDVVVVVPEGAAPAVAPADLAAAHGGAANTLVLASAPADLDLGLQGAFAGVGRGWAVDRTALLQTRFPDAEDELELRWQLWNDGCAVRRAPTAVTEPVDVAATTVRADRVPHPLVRPWDLTEASVPTVSVIVHGADPDPAVTEPWPVRSRVPSEVLLVGAPGPRTGRVRAVPDLRAALGEATGALVWFVHRDAVAHREAWARALRRFEDDRIDWVQVAYELPNGVSRSSRGLLLADRELDAPAFALVRRRALLRSGRDAASLHGAWAAVLDGRRGTIVASHPVPVDVDVRRRPVPTLTALAAGATELARDVVRDVRDRADDAAPVEEPTDRPSVGWVGFSGQGNFGDELVLEAARELLPGVDVVPGGEGTHGTVLGGGTLLNAVRYYQRIAHDIDAPGLRRLVLGTGVVSPEVKGWTEELAGWRAFLDAGPVGVRGPHSVGHLRAWAAAELPDWRGEVEVLGDPALALAPTADPVDGLVVLAPIGASDVGQVAADDERHQVDLLVAVARAARADGRPVRLLTAHAGDDRVAVALLRALGDEVDDVVTAHRDIDAGLSTLAAADIVIGARLHALVAAAAAGTRFVGLAYRPKVADFAASVGMEDQVAPIGAWTVPGLVARLAGGTDDEQHGAMLAAVDGYRSGLRERVAGYLDDL